MNKFCKKCNKVKSSSEFYKDKRDIKDYIQLCTRCHRKFDNGNLIIRTTKGLLEREKILETKCPKCNHLFEIKL